MYNTLYHGTQLSRATDKDPYGLVILAIPRVVNKAAFPDFFLKLLVLDLDGGPPLLRNTTFW